MKKYYYYTFQAGNITSSAVCVSESGSFPLDSCTEFIRGLYEAPIIITFWHEISSAEFDLYCEKNSK